ncbi:SHOCT domain-containing protein [Mycolicibacterium pulveris]|uniref:SHOCT domain-containing protein n=1 Tax=Mycolicibacterium pulveris TaxID=36813 RepID=UPI003CEE7D48
MWTDIWQVFWTAVLIFLFIAYLLILFNILVDLFVRDHETSGWTKALWVLFLVVLPYLTALVYLIVRGKDMAVRARAEARAAHQATDAYLSATGRTPVQEIADAKRLLDEEVITREEFDLIKAKILR